MRDLTSAEDKVLQRGECPFCGGREFYEGPQGGMSINIFCANPDCEAGFNVSGFIFPTNLIQESKK